MRQVAVTEIKGELAKYLKLAQKDTIVITRRGKPVGVLTGVKSEEDLFDLFLERDPWLWKRLEEAEKSIEAGLGTKLEDVEL